MDAPGRPRTEAARAWSPRAPRLAGRWWAGGRDAAPSRARCSREAARPRAPAWAAARGAAGPLPEEEQGQEGERRGPVARGASRAEAAAARTPRSESRWRRGAWPRVSRAGAAEWPGAPPGRRAHPEARPDGLPRGQPLRAAGADALPRGRPLLAAGADALPGERRAHRGRRGAGPPRALQGSRARPGGRRRARREPSRSDGPEAGPALRSREAARGRRAWSPGTTADGQGTRPARGPRPDPSSNPAPRAGSWPEGRGVYRRRSGEAGTSRSSISLDWWPRRADPPHAPRDESACWPGWTPGCPPPTCPRTWSAWWTSSAPSPGPSPTRSPGRRC